MNVPNGTLTGTVMYETFRLDTNRVCPVIDDESPGLFFCRVSSLYIPVHTRECTVHYTIRLLPSRTVVSRTNAVAGGVRDDALDDQAGLLQPAQLICRDPSGTRNMTLLTIQNH